MGKRRKSFLSADRAIERSEEIARRILIEFDNKGITVQIRLITAAMIAAKAIIRYPPDSEIQEVFFELVEKQVKEWTQEK